MRSSALCVLLFLGVGPLLCASPLVKFPGPASRSESPDKTYVLRNVDGARGHTLFLKRHKDGVERRLYVYQRHVAVSWSPDSQAVFMNDYGGSDFARCIVFLLAEPGRQIDIESEFSGKVSEQGAKKSVSGNHHVYFEALDWIDAETIKLRVSGYGDVDPKGFKMVYSYKLGGEFSPVEGTR